MQQSSLRLAFPVHAVNGNPPTRAQSHDSGRVALWEIKTDYVYKQVLGTSAQQSSLPLAFPVQAVNGNPPTRAQSHASGIELPCGNQKLVVYTNRFLPVQRNNHHYH